jgi:hypothetical protein
MSANYGERYRHSVQRSRGMFRFADVPVEHPKHGVAREVFEH